MYGKDFHYIAKVRKTNCPDSPRSKKNQVVCHKNHEQEIIDQWMDINLDLYDCRKSLKKIEEEIIPRSSHHLLFCNLMNLISKFNDSNNVTFYNIETMTEDLIDNFEPEVEKPTVMPIQLFEFITIIS
jgi:hypothetical protein